MGVALFVGASALLVQRVCERAKLCYEKIKCFTAGVSLAVCGCIDHRTGAARGQLVYLHLTPETM